MTDSSRQFDDPLWTAYVLDELPAEQRKVVEERLAHDPAAQSEIRTLRDTVALVFAALQSEPVDELTAAQRQRIRAAAQRQLNSLASTAPGRMSGMSASRPAAAGRRATRGAVLLASLAMAAVALVVVSVTPDAPRTTEVATRLLSRDAMPAQNYLVFQSEGRDASGTEHLNLAFNYRGVMNVNGLPTDATNGIHYLDVSTPGEQLSQRFYVTPVMPPGNVAQALTTSAGSGAVDLYSLTTDGSTSAPLSRWVEPGGIEADADVTVRLKAAWAMDRSQPAVNEALEAVPKWFDSGNNDYSHDWERAAGFGVQTSAARQSATRFVQREGQLGGANAQERGFTLPTASANGQTPLSAGEQSPAGTESGGARGGPTTSASVVDHQSSDLSVNGPELRQRLSKESRRALEFRPATLEQIERQPLQEGGGQPAPVQAELERTLRAESIDALADEAKPPVPAIRPGADTTAALPYSDPERLGELMSLAEQEVRLRDSALTGLPAQQPAATEFTERNWTSYFQFVRGDSPAEESVAFAKSLSTPLAVTDEIARSREALQRAGGEDYTRIIEREFTSVLDAPVSTFSIDTDTAAYSNVRRFLDDAQWPPADAVRIEELVNYFPYDDPEPTDDHPVAVAVEAASCPWQPNHRLARISLKAQEVDDARRPATSLVFLVDVSGSMQDENKLPLAQQSLRMLTDQLTGNDRIALVTYADEARIVLDGAAGAHRDVILTAVDALSAGGSTNGAGGLTVAYDVARRHYIANGTNRVILCSDGDFNVGISDDDELVRLIEEQRKSGVFLSIFGFGTGNLKDGKLEKLADHGNGQYFYIDSLDEARKAFVEQLMGTLYTVARDVKLQVDFNPLQVASYRLVGYENRDLSAQDFDNDAVDAGELGSGHTVTALYEYVPRAAPVQDEAARLNEAVNSRSVRFGAVADGAIEVRHENEAVTIDGEVYSEQRKSELGNAVQAVFGSTTQRRYPVDNRLKVVARLQAEEGRLPFNDTLTVRLRYKRATAEESVRLDVSLVDSGRQAAPSPDFEWAAAVAAFGLLLRQSHYQQLANFDAVLETAQAAKGNDPTGRRREFIDLVRQARSLWTSQSGNPSPDTVALPSVEAYEKATVTGKYTNLLEKVGAPDDASRYGAFHDYGRWEGTTYRDRSGLPPGYWVYVYPDWFIWGSLSPRPAAAAAPEAP